MKQSRGTPEASFYRKITVTSGFDVYLNEIYRVVGNLLSLQKFDEKAVLDVGCGCGNLLASVRGRRLKVGVDVSSTAVTSAVSAVKNVFFVVCDAANLPFRKECFDVVVCSEVLEHMSSPEKVTRQIKSVLKSNGIIIVTVPNLGEIYGWALLVLGLSLILRSTSYRTNLIEYWRKTISLGGIRSPHIGHLHVRLPTSWRKMIVKSGFKVERSFGILSLPLGTFTYRYVGKYALLKMLKQDDATRYTFPMNYMANGIGFIAQKA
jgi:2-polyprenyl-3-methyl-5-hydroxy-6-metoxy-1,4-benzoquinol methylase